MSERIDIERHALFAYLASFLLILSKLIVGIIKNIKNDGEDFEFKSTTMMFKDEQGRGLTSFCCCAFVLFFCSFKCCCLV